MSEAPEVSFFGNTDTAEVALQQILGQMKELVQLALECKDRPLKEGVSLADISAHILRLQEVVDEMQATYATLVDTTSMSEQEKKQMEQAAQELSPERKKMYTEIQDMQQQCEHARDEMYTSLQQNRGTLKDVEDSLKDEKTKQLKRKGKFKNIGGKKGWIPS